ncbi:hypothetical protein MVEN_00341700 [Mycena venus]|uniref:YTH domain-containing protein n=1 Tax=Mycena venus TaxID=2733690 RepID=A0A8H7D737_9AGAR|nr:hypothetical protein MVEN_00341700 [Mycena venus]
MAETPYEVTLTPKPSHHQLNEDHIDRTADTPRAHGLSVFKTRRVTDDFASAVYAFTPTPGETESGLKAHSSGVDAFMSRHGRGGTDQARSGGTGNRRQSSQQQRQTTGYPSLNAPPESPPGYHPPLYATANVQYPPPQQRSGYPGQYMMSPQPPLNMAHTPPNVFPYPPAFHVQEQPHSIHAGYPTIASYSQYQADTPAYSSPAVPRRALPPAAVPRLLPQSSSFSPPPAMYQHQHQQHVYPGAGSYAQYPTQHHSPGAQDGGEAGGTWWYVPSQPAQHTSQQAYEAGPSTYSYYPPAHAQQHTDGGGGGGGEFPGAPGSHPASPTYAHARPSTPSSASLPSPMQPGGSGRERPMVRRSYHPNPPAHRSDWVMWAGNVPSDAVHDELWRFFTQPPDDGGSTASSSSSGGSVEGGPIESGGGERNRNGVLSIFLISRSSCAFVNYETEAHLQVAIARFNGVPLRADPRCARLVCRVRRKDDDLRAGVGGQRGSGMHTKWVKAKQKAQSVGHGQDQDSASSASDPGTPSSGSHSLEQSISALSIGSGDDDDGPTRPPPRPHAASNSSGSHASTNSSLLRQHFPQRYFILKSLTRDDLDLSVQTGVWATQKHNEGILDRAFRTSKDVFLIFSVNKSGEFYGYARMAGPIGQGEGSGRVTWARRDSSASNTSASASGRSPLASTSQSVPMNVAGNHGASFLPTPPHAQILSGDRNVENSPQPFPTPTSTPLRPHDVQSAPAVLGKPHRNISTSSPAVKGASLDQYVADSSQRRETIDLDETAPYRKMRSPPMSEAAVAAAVAEAGRSHERRESLTGSTAPLLGSVAEEAVVEGGSVVGAPREEGWGENFKLQWLCTDRLPFLRTRHIRNPWNHDREIKVSRDGTEIEPTVGQALLEEWRLYLASEAGGVAAGTGTGTGTGAGAQTPMPLGGDSMSARSSRAGGGGVGSRS